jgi:hypothetical protein
MHGQPHIRSEFYVPTFWNTLSVPSSQTGRPACEDGTDSMFQNIGTKFIHWGITQKKAYSVQNTAKVWNQEWSVIDVLYWNPPWLSPTSLFRDGVFLERSYWVIYRLVVVLKFTFLHAVLKCLFLYCYDWSLLIVPFAHFPLFVHETCTTFTPNILHLGSVSSPLCVWKLERLCSQTQLYHFKVYLMAILDNYTFRPLLAIFRLS